MARKFSGVPTHTMMASISRSSAGRLGTRVPRNVLFHLALSCGDTVLTATVTRRFLRLPLTSTYSATESLQFIKNLQGARAPTGPPRLLRRVPIGRSSSSRGRAPAIRMDTMCICRSPGRSGSRTISTMQRLPPSDRLDACHLRAARGVRHNIRHRGACGSTDPLGAGG